METSTACLSFEQQQQQLQLSEQDVCQPANRLTDNGGSGRLAKLLSKLPERMKAKGRKLSVFSEVAQGALSPHHQDGPALPIWEVHKSCSMNEARLSCRQRRFAKKQR